MTVIATAGHVDHGKSSLVRALTGIEPDRLAEEQRKGMTIDLGFAHMMAASGTVLSFVDVPGHTDFIRTMIAGASGVDVALLVIDAGEGWKPQTEEHLGILEVLGVQCGVVALSKCDRVDDATARLRHHEIADRLATSSIEWSGIVHTSANTGAGLDELTSILSRLTTTVMQPDAPDAPRLFVDRVFTIKGSGTVVTGTLDSAALAVNETLVVARTRRQVRVRSLQMHGESVTDCRPGNRCAANIVGDGTDDIVRGDALVRPSSWFDTTVFDARLTVLAGHRGPLTHRGSFTVHVGSHFQSATVRIIDGDSIGAGGTGRVRVRFRVPLPLRPTDRFLLRDTSTNVTVGGGEILDVDPVTRLSRADPDGSVQSIMAGRGFVPVRTAELLTGQRLEPVTGTWYATHDALESARAGLLARLGSTATISLAELKDHERDLVGTLPDVVIDGDVARLRAVDPVRTHPLLAEIRSWGLTGPGSSTVDRNIVRQLVQRGLVFEHDSIAFHVDTLNDLRGQLAVLWQRHPEGFLVSHLRETLGITRKHAVPLAECLDRLGLTRRIGDARVPGHAW